MFASLDFQLTKSLKIQFTQLDKKSNNVCWKVVFLPPSGQKKKKINEFSFWITNQESWKGRVLKKILGIIHSIPN